MAKQTNTPAVTKAGRRAVDAPVTAPVAAPKGKVSHAASNATIAALVQATTPAAPAAPAAPAPTVALRGGPAVQQVKLTGKLYRSAAKHNTDWWAQVQAAAATNPAPVADLVKAGVPTHFIGYTMRRGYLVAA